MINADTELERKVIASSIMYEPSLLTLIELIQRDDIFTDSTCRNAYRAIKRLLEASKEVDMISVSKEMESMKCGKLENIFLEMSQICAVSDAPASMPQLCNYLIDIYTRRRLTTAGLMIQSFQNDDSDSLSLISKAMELLNSIDEDIHLSTELSFKEQVRNTVEHVLKIGSSKELSGVRTGFSDLDKATGGWQPSTYYLIAARPSMGKSALMLSFAKAAVKAKIPAGIFSLEMGYQQLIKRLISSMGGNMDMVKMKKGVSEDHDVQALINLGGVLDSYPLLIDDTPNQSVTYITYKAKKWVKKHGIKIILVDYVGIAKGYDTVKYGTNKVAEVSDISNALKQLAKALDIPVIALAQLSRDVEKRGGNKRPMMSDLRDSGSLEQDADVIIFPYRPEYYDIEEWEDGTSTAGQMELIIAKGRDIGTGTFRKGYNLKTQEIYDLDTGGYVSQLEPTGNDMDDYLEEDPF